MIYNSCFLLFSLFRIFRKYYNLLKKYKCFILAISGTFDVIIQYNRYMIRLIRVKALPYSVYLFCLICMSKYCESLPRKRRKNDISTKEAHLLSASVLTHCIDSRKALETISCLAVSCQYDSIVRFMLNNS